MYKGKRFLAIIPARGGSKGLPKKNIKDINGKPLIFWSLAAAKNCDYIDEVYVSTDSQEIADVCEKFGVKVPELRPKYLAQDTSTSADVVIQVLDLFKSRGKDFDYFVLLEPTSPLRKKEDLNNIIELAIDNKNCESVVSMGKVHMEHPMIVKKYINEKILPYIENAERITQRQQVDDAYFPYGVAYLVKTSAFKENRIFYGEKSLPYFIERWQNYEVDDIYDFKCIETIMKERESELWANI